MVNNRESCLLDRTGLMGLFRGQTNLHIVQTKFKLETESNVPPSSDPTVVCPVLHFSSEDKTCGKGRNGNVKDELPHVPRAEQVQVA